MPSNISCFKYILNYYFQYKLETFAEKRESQWVYEPYRGQPISSRGLGPPPTPYEVYVIPEVPFHRSQKTIEIPQTANIRVCHICTGNGRIRCTHCFGYGGVSLKINDFENYCYLLRNTQLLLKIISMNFIYDSENQLSNYSNIYQIIRMSENKFIIRRRRARFLSLIDFSEKYFHK